MPNRRTDGKRPHNIELEDLLQCEKQLKKELNQEYEAALLSAPIVNSQWTAGKHEPSRKYLTRSQSNAANADNQPRSAFLEKISSQAGGPCNLRETLKASGSPNLDTMPFPAGKRRPLEVGNFERVDHESFRPLTPKSMSLLATGRERTDSRGSERGKAVLHPVAQQISTTTIAEHMDNMPATTTADAMDILPAAASATTTAEQMDDLAATTEVFHLTTPPQGHLRPEERSGSSILDLISQICHSLLLHILWLFQDPTRVWLMITLWLIFSICIYIRTFGLALVSVPSDLVNSLTATGTIIGSGIANTSIALSLWIVRTTLDVFKFGGDSVKQFSSATTSFACSLPIAPNLCVSNGSFAPKKSVAERVEDAVNDFAAAAERNV